jgi:hypothetical protein
MLRIVLRIKQYVKYYIYKMLKTVLRINNTVTYCICIHNSYTCRYILVRSRNKAGFDVLMALVYINMHFIPVLISISIGRYTIYMLHIH